MKKIIIAFIFILSFSFAFSADATTLRVGMKGNSEIVQLQQNLQTLGFYDGSLDGSFGPKTKRAVVSFQLANNLVGDGVVGPKTSLKIASIAAINISGVSNSVWDKLCLDGKPHAKVTSPNGGETFSVGKKITVTWDTCNVSRDVDGSIMLIYRNPNGGVWGQALVTANGNLETKNDGTEEVKLFTKNQIVSSNGVLGQFYGIQVTFDEQVPSSGNKFSDSSDSSFTINQ